MVKLKSGAIGLQITKKLTYSIRQYPNLIYHILSSRKQARGEKQSAVRFTEQSERSISIENQSLTDSTIHDQQTDETMDYRVLTNKKKEYL